MFGKVTKRQLYRQVEEIAKAYGKELDWSNKLLDENLELMRQMMTIEDEYHEYQMQYGDYPSMDDYEDAQQRIQELEKENNQLQRENIKLEIELSKLRDKIADSEIQALFERLGIES